MRVVVFDFETGSSPHTRGALSSYPTRELPRRIIPAYAGSTPAIGPLLREGADHPRIRGEHVVFANQVAKTKGSSPHTRGALVFTGGHPPDEWIIPAYAGSTSAPASDSGSEADHPRIRGEHLRGFLEVPGYGGSSPHTRGARPTISSRCLPSRIIPAYAGSTALQLDVWTTYWDHPRIRGEHRRRRRPAWRRRGSSPHTRGAHVRGGRGAGIERIIPAYAGSTLLGCRASSSRQDHPRIRGEHKIMPNLRRISHGSSPHTRGARQTRRRRPDRDGIIPAYAGSTRRRSPPWPAPSDHPRIRGEHLENVVHGAHRLGSSPHTRGARRRGAAPCGRRRIIPAYAGST